MSLTVNINVADQAYPAPPPESQALPVPSSVAVASLPALQPSFAQGAASPDVPDNDVRDQVSVLQPVQEWLVTESGNFQTSNNVGDRESFTIGAVTTFGSGTAAVYQISLLRNGLPVSLSGFGVDFTGLIMSFPAEAPASAPENVPQRPISYYVDPNLVVVPAVDSLGNTLAAPSPGDAVSIGVLRQGPSLILDNNVDEIDVVVAPAPPVALTLPAPQVTDLGNVQAQDGVVRPFIGEGQRLPPFIGTFEVEDQPLIGRGLPQNIFV